MDKTIFSKVRKIQIKTSKMVTEIFSGEYRSVFKGRGMEFEEVREYQPGDEIRSIDWNVTARMGRPFIKQFKEERELTVFFIVDISSSMGFGSKERTKRELVAELCAVLAFTAIQNNDKVGVILFSDHVEKYIPPAKGKRHVLRVIRELLAAGTEKKDICSGTDLNASLEYFNKVQRKRAVCFLVSDFFCEGYEKTISITTRKHDLIAIKTEDPLENKFLPAGLLVLEDLESGKQLLADLSSQKTIDSLNNHIKILNENLKKQFRTKGIDFFIIRTGEDYAKILTKFFRERERRLKG